MAITLALTSILAVLAGVVILIWPRSLNVAVGLYLLITGIVQLLSQYNFI